MPVKLVCIDCGADGEGSCNCGAPYVKPSQRAAAYVQAHPEMSDRAIASVLGISHETVRQVRNRSTVNNLTVETRTGRDGRTRRMPRRSPQPTAMERARDAVRPLVQSGQQIGARRLGREIGISHCTMEAAIEAERALVEAEHAEPVVRREDLSPSAQQRFDAAVRRIEREMEARCAEQVRVQIRDGLSQRLEGVRLQMAEEKRHYEAVIKGRRGIMTRDVFNKIRRCLHPDSRNSVTDELLAEAFRLFELLKINLLNETDFPVAGPAIPTVQDLMRGYQQYQEEQQARAATRRARRNTASQTMN